MFRLMVLSLVVVAASVFASAAQADRRSSGGQVVHSRLAPVIMHRMVPPYKGVHVYQGRR